MEFIISQKVFYTPKMLTKKSGKDKNYKAFRMSTYVSVLKAWLKNNKHRDLCRFFNAMAYTFREYDDYRWLSGIFDNVNRNIMDSKDIIKDGCQKYEIFNAIWNNNKSITKLADDLSSKYLYFIFFSVNCGNTTDVGKKLFSEEYQNYFYNMPIYEVEYFIMCIDMSYFTGNRITINLMDRINEILYPSKILPSNKIQWKLLTDYSERKAQLRLKYHIMNAFMFIQDENIDKFLQESRKIEILTGTDIYTNIFMIYNHIKNGNYPQCFSIIKNLKQQNLKIPGRSELFFGKQYILNCEIVALAQQRKFNYAYHIFDHFFDDKDIICKSTKIIGPGLYMWANICHNGAILSLIHGKFMRSCQFIIKAKTILKKDINVLLLYIVMCHLCEDYKLCVSSIVKIEELYMPQAIFQILGLSIYNNGFVYPATCATDPTEYLFIYENAYTCSKFIRNYLNNNRHNISMTHFLIIYGATLLKTRRYNECVSMLEPFLKSSTELPYIIHYLLIIWVAEAHLYLAHYEGACSVLKTRYFRNMEFESLPHPTLHKRVHFYSSYPLPSSKDEAIMNLDFNILVVKCSSKIVEDLQTLFQHFSDKYISIIQPRRLDKIKNIINKLTVAAVPQ